MQRLIRGLAAYFTRLGELQISPSFQFPRYVVAGVLVSSGYTLTVFLVVSTFSAITPTYASAISFILWTPISYWVHRDFTFRYKSRSGKTAAKFLVVFLSRLVLSSLVVYIFAAILHLHYIFGALANWIVLPALNYLAFDNLVFREVGTSRQPISAE